MKAVDKKPCIYNLHTYCVVFSNLYKNGKEVENWGSEEWIKLHCAMCVKTIYAKAKMKLIKYAVVNTL